MNGSFRSRRCAKAVDFSNPSPAGKDVLSPPRISVHELPDAAREAHDLHPVIVHINTADIALSSVDEFFAGVRYRWPEVEGRLLRLVAPSSLLNRRSAIELPARVVARDLPSSLDGGESEGEAH